MALAVCLLFDPETDRAIRRLWAALEEVGIGTLLSHTHRRHVPHLSYAVVRSFDAEVAGHSPTCRETRLGVRVRRGRQPVAGRSDAGLASP